MRNITSLSSIQNSCLEFLIGQSDIDRYTLSRVPNFNHIHVGDINTNTGQYEKLLLSKADFPR